jgi:DNA-binding MarR family transcriptional regulator
MVALSVSRGFPVVASSAHHAVSVRMLLRDLEASTGLDALTEGERNVLAALVLCGGLSRTVRPGDLRQHPLAAGLTHPTYHRVLRGLVDRGIVDYRAEPREARGYLIIRDPAATAAPAGAMAAQ